MSEHFVEKCPCGIIISQCRCAEGLGEKKTVRIVPCRHATQPAMTDHAPLGTVEQLRAHVAELEGQLEKATNAPDHWLRKNFQLEQQLATVTAERDATQKNMEANGVLYRKLFEEHLDAQHQLAARTYTWTTARPTVAGDWYWQAPGFGPEVFRVYLLNGPDTDELGIEDESLEEFIARRPDSEWAGPIMGPEETTR